MTKKCGYCSRRHPDNALTCPCGSLTAFGPRNALIHKFLLGAVSGEYTPGNDISTWQEHPAIPGDIDFDRMADLSEYVFIKRSQTLFPDADGARNYEWSRGKLRRGAYLYLTWERPLVDQVDYFFSLFPTLESLGELPPVLDFEEWSNAPEPGTARAQLRAAIERAEYHLNRLGWDLRRLPLILYTSPGYWATFGSADTWWREHCDLWIAHYYVNQPSIPLPWRVWRFWQWTDKGDGLAHGVESKQIDMNWYFGTVEEFIAYALPLPGSTPPPEPPEGEIMQKWEIVSDSANVRTLPKDLPNSRVIAVLGRGAKVTGTGNHDARPEWPHQHWVEIVFGDGTAWIAEQYYEDGRILAKTVS